MLRLVEANAYGWGGDKLARLGANLGRLAHGEGLGFAVAHGQARSDQIAFSTPRRLERGSYRLGSQDLAGSQIVFGRKRFCGACWTDDRATHRIDRYGDAGGFDCHLRNWWSVAAVAACPIHCVELTDRCSDCGGETTFWNGSLTVCRCGADLVRMPGSATGSRSVALEAYVAGRLGAIPCRPIPLLDRFPLEDAIALIPRLGGIANGIRHARLSDLGKADRAALVGAGIDVAIQGDVGVESVLAAVMERSGRIEGFTNALGPFHAWFANSRGGPLHGWLAERICAVARSNKVHWSGWRPPRSDGMLPDRVTAKQAGRILQLGHGPTRRVLAASRLLPDDGTKRLRPTADRSDVEAIRAELDRLVCARTAASKMGVSIKAFHALTTAGIVRSSRLGGLAFGDARSFDPAHLEQVLAAIGQNAKHVAAPPPGASTLDAASRPFGLIRLCRLILEGEIVPCGRLAGASGLSAVLVGGDWRRIAAEAGFRQADARERHDARSGTAQGRRVGIGTARRRLCIRERTMALLLANGYFHGWPDGVDRRSIACLSVDEFESRYISTSALARAWRTNTRSVLRKTGAAGVHPSIRIDCPGRTEARFFDRSATETLTTSRAAGRSSDAPEVSTPDVFRDAATSTDPVPHRRPTGFVTNGSATRTGMRTSVAPGRRIIEAAGELRRTPQRPRSRARRADTLGGEAGDETG